MKINMTEINLDVWTGSTFVTTTVLIRSDWVKVKVNEYSDVDISQCVRSESGQLVFVYPTDEFGEF